MSGLYVHVPFCAQKCSYCDFHFSTSFESYRKEMIYAIANEICERKEELSTPLRSVYFGGGTPSILNKQELALILDSVFKSFSLDDDLELTLEANPENISFENTSDWKKLGFNRLSIGLQSFKKEDLVWMNRNHSSEDNLSCLQTVQNVGFKNISVDLMYGLPDLSSKEWLSFLDKVTSLGVQHLVPLSRWTEQYI